MGIKNYNTKNKNRIRQLIIDKIREYDINSILTLESPQFLFSKALPDKKIMVWENDADVLKEMEGNCPKNVELIFGNIGKFGIFNSKVDMIYLDFCKTWMSEQTEVLRLKDSLKHIKLFAITICLRESKTHKETGNVFDGDYQFDLIKKIQEITSINWKVIYGESYYDSLQMVTIIMGNPNESKDKENNGKN